MVNKLVHFSDLHIRLFKDHDLYRSILETAIEQWKELSPDRIIFTGDLVHSKNQLTPELIEIVSWVFTECSNILKTIIIPRNHDFLTNNTERLDALSPIINSIIEWFEENRPMKQNQYVEETTETEEQILND